MNRILGKSYCSQLLQLHTPVHIYHIRPNWILISYCQQEQKEKLKRIENGLSSSKEPVNFFSFEFVSAITMPQKIRKPWGKKLIQRISWSSATYWMIYYSNTSAVPLVPPLHWPTCHPCSHRSWAMYKCQLSDRL